MMTAPTTPVSHPSQIPAARWWWALSTVLRLLRAAAVPSLVVWFISRPPVEDYHLLVVASGMLGVWAATHYTERRAWDAVPGTCRTFRSLAELWAQLPAAFPDRMITALALTIQAFGFIYAATLHELVGQFIHAAAVALCVAGLWRAARSALFPVVPSPLQPWVKALVSALPSLPLLALVVALTPAAPNEVMVCVFALTAAALALLHLSPARFRNNTGPIFINQSPEPPSVLARDTPTQIG